MADCVFVYQHHDFAFVLIAFRFWQFLHEGLYQLSITLIDKKARSEEEVIEKFFKSFKATTPTKSIALRSVVNEAHLQESSAYNAAQTNEKDHCQSLSRMSCAKASPNHHRRKGRPRWPLDEMSFTTTLGVLNSFAATVHA